MSPEEELELLNDATKAVLIKHFNDGELAKLIHYMMVSFTELSDANANRALPPPTADFTAEQIKDYHIARDAVSKMIEMQNKRLVQMIQDAKKLLLVLTEDIHKQDYNASLEDIALITEVNKVIKQSIVSPQHIDLEKLEELKDIAYQNVKNADARFKDKESAALSKRRNANIAKAISVGCVVAVGALALAIAIATPLSAPIAVLIVLGCLSAVGQLLGFSADKASEVLSKHAEKSESEVKNIDDLQNVRKSTLLGAKKIHADKFKPSPDPEGTRVLPSNKNK